MLYYAVKYIHITCAVISITGFVWRGVGKFAGMAWMRRRWVRIAPHVIDTLLLLSALYLSYLIQQYPFVQPWLTAKVLALIAYILFGMVALRWGRAPLVRIGAWAGAIAIFAYIVSVAVTRNPLGFVGSLL